MSDNQISPPDNGVPAEEAATVAPVSQPQPAAQLKEPPKVSAPASAPQEPKNKLPPKAPTKAPAKKSSNTWLWIILIVAVLGLLGSLGLNFILALAVAGGNSLSGSAGPTYMEKTIEGSGKDKILYLPLEGVISSSAQEYGSSIRDRQVAEMLEQALKDKNIKGAILEVNSPGGEVTASDKIHHAVTKFVREKPLYILMGDLCASGGVYMSVHASKIYAYPTTTTGSIGVIMHTYNVEQLLDKVGVKALSIKSGAMKDILSPSREMTPEEKAILQQFVMDSYERFVKLVADGRHLKVEEVKKFADGRILTAAQAKEVGLIDEIAYLDEVKADLLRELGLSEALIVTYKRPFSFMSLSDAQMQMSFSPEYLKQLGHYLSTPRQMYLWQINK